MRFIFIVMGFVFCGIGAIGAFVPILPTVPFLLLASFFFAKGSDRFSIWFHETSIYKKHLEEFDRNRSMSLRKKIGILVLASSMLIYAYFMISKVPVRILIILLMVSKYYYFIFKIKTEK